VIFDLGGTLWNWPRRNPTRDGALLWGLCHDRLQATPRGVGREAFAAAMVASEADYRRRARNEGLSASPRDIVAAGMQRLGAPTENGGFLREVIGSYGQVASGLPVPFPDARQTLLALHGTGFRLGILSNTWWSAAWIDADLRTARLHGLFEEVLYTSDLPHSKPHPSAFLEAASRLGAEPSRCVMVGDDPLCDVWGASRVGMPSVWVRRDDSMPGGAEATAVVESLSELTALLRP
jgi:putative hydrolase of the HAD superfamily